MKQIIASLVIVPVIAGAVWAQTSAIKDLKSQAGPDAVVAVPQTQAAPASAAAKDSFIITGWVTAVKDVPYAAWKIAEVRDYEVRADKVSSGRRSAIVDVWFPSSANAASQGAHRFIVGEQVRIVLQYNDSIGGHYTALGPKDVSPSYRACGCGCCPGVLPRSQCLYHAKGDALDDIIAKDKAARQSPQCALVGCSMGLVYSYCD